MSEDPQAYKYGHHTAAEADAKPEKATHAPPLDAAASSEPELVSKDKDNDNVAEPIVASASDVPSSAGETVDSAGLVQRRSRWYSSLAALRYVSSLAKDDDVRVRDSDRATAIALLLSSILTLISLVWNPLASHRLTLVLVCDALVGLMLLFYVANRLGILNTLTPRQALLSWQLIMGAGFIGIFTTINLAVAIALVVAHTAIDIH